MDRQVSESHSDSDSGESWTLLDTAPSYTAAEPTPCPGLQSADTYRSGEEKDEDTDGISIISECESDTTESCEYVQQEEMATVAPGPVEQDSDYADLLGDATGYGDLLGDTKLKTYVHRRNSKVSSALNVIVLGSLITAACLALGHMWGARDDCPQQSSTSLNKLLSNLYKLQEENAYLRTKLKQLTLPGHGYNQLSKNSTPKQCKKTTEEPLQRARVVSAGACVEPGACADPDAEIDRPLLKYVKTELTAPGHRVENNQHDEKFQSDLQKLRSMYQENRNWLEQQLTKRLNNEKDLANGHDQKPPSQEKAIVQPEKAIDRKEYFEGESKLDASKIPPVAYSGSRTRDQITEAQLGGPDQYKYRHKLSLELSDEEFSPPKEIRLKKLIKKKHSNDERFKKEVKTNKKDDRSEFQYERENRSRHMKNRDKVGSRDNTYSPDYNMHVNYVHKFSKMDRKSAEKETKASKTDFVIVHRVSDDSKKKKVNDSVHNSVLGDWFHKRSVMRRRAREQPRHRVRETARWYFLRMSERERARAAKNYQRKQRTFKYAS